MLLLVCIVQRPRHVHLRLVDQVKLTANFLFCVVSSAINFTQGFTAMHLAIIRGHEEAVKVLLEAGFDPSTESKLGWNAIDEA